MQNTCVHTYLFHHALNHPSSITSMRRNITDYRLPIPFTVPCSFSWMPIRIRMCERRLSTFPEIPDRNELDAMIPVLVPFLLGFTIVWTVAGVAGSKDHVIPLSSLRSDIVWTAASANGTSERNISIAAEVPGGIYSDLEANGLLETPIYYRFNDQETAWVGRTNWTFSRIFQVTSAFLDKNVQVLVCEGLDTVSELFLNDVLVGRSENMFVRYIFHVRGVLQRGNNSIRVGFESPVEYSRKEWERQEKLVAPEVSPRIFRGEDHINFVRKMQASFAWDWGPSYPSTGIWKDIYVQAYDIVVIRDVTIFLKTNTTRPDETSRTFWNVTARIYLENLENLDANTVRGMTNLSLNLQIQFPGRKLMWAFKFLSGLPFQVLSIGLSGDQVKLWWPNGYGEQPLYPVRVTLVKDGREPEELSSYSVAIGFRTVVLVQDPVHPQNPEHGNEFYIKVNGIPIFAKGANLVPIHVLPERATPEATRWLLESARIANMNMIRVWGGGIYPSDLFYQLADEMGLMIWQDLMFACAKYPTNGEFLESVQLEVDSQVKRLQHHPSLVLWAGNNEIEEAITAGWWKRDNFEADWEDYVILFVRTIRELVKELDPSRPFLRSSPSNGQHLEDWEEEIAQIPSDHLRGDAHFYNYREDSWDWTTFGCSRFVSEYGYQSWPSLDTLELSTDPKEDWFLDSPMMAHRQRHLNGHFEIMDLAYFNFPIPEEYLGRAGFRIILELSRLSQAMGMKTETESYRRMKGVLDPHSGRGHTIGALYWQLTDIWAGASWGSIEWTGQWKLLHYYARNFFAPIIVSPYKTYTGKIESGVRIDIVSDLLHPTTSEIHVQVFRIDRNTSHFNPVFQAHLHFQAALLEAKNVANLSLDHDLEVCRDLPIHTICLLTTSMPGSPDNFLFLQYPNTVEALPNPKLRIGSIKVDSSAEKFMVELEAETVGLFVTLNVKGVKGFFSDNGFMLTTPTKTIEFQSPTDDPFTRLHLSEFRKNLEFWSLYDVLHRENLTYLPIKKQLEESERQRFESVHGKLFLVLLIFTLALAPCLLTLSLMVLSCCAKRDDSYMFGERQSH